MEGERSGDSFHRRQSSPCHGTGRQARARAWGTLCLDCFWNKPRKPELYNRKLRCATQCQILFVRGTVGWSLLPPSRSALQAGCWWGGGQAAQLRRGCPVLSLQALWSQQLLRGAPGRVTTERSWTLAKQCGASSRRGGLSCLLLRAAASTTSARKIKPH